MAVPIPTTISCLAYHLSQTQTMTERRDTLTIRSCKSLSPWRQRWAMCCIINFVLSVLPATGVETDTKRITDTTNLKSQSNGEK
jgi:hypothetical protein